MFTVGDYKIVFRRRWHIPKRACLIDGTPFSDGRYDTVCEIYDDTGEVPRCTGVVKLHPNDQVDRIVGKKLALKRALDVMLPSDQKKDELMYDYYERKFKNKNERTEIWHAFFKWVASWNNKPVNRT